ncbi:MAG: hypothetical protein U9Q83_10960 [Bacteroidota bacterium]|nr:hypothetical protein [Bacteroidota bacterium]
MNKIYIIFISLTIVFSGCFKAPEVDYDYQQYNRIVGSEGGILTFYANYANDSNLYLTGIDTTTKILELNVPAGALDTDVVFNFYQYDDIEIAKELSKGLSNVGSKFIYFVPVLASDGYHESDNADLTYHLSLKFNKPITVKYYFDLEKELNTIDEKKLQFEFYDRTNVNYKLYRLKIPEIDEWGEQRNIFVQWNQQDYPIGYNTNDINDIIMGLWYKFSDPSENRTSLVNWEEVENVTFDGENSISFDIESTDYIYVIAQVINITQDYLPLKIVNYIQDLYELGIKRAAFVDQQFQIILENDYVLYFYRNGDFNYAEKHNLLFSDIPEDIFTYITTNYSGQNIKSNLVRIFPGLPNYSLEYSITLTNDESLFFTGDSSSVAYAGKIIYDYDENSLSSDIKDYIYSNFNEAKIQNIILNDVFGFYVVFIKYEQRNAKLYFDFSGNLVYIVYYGLKQTEISPSVEQYLDETFPGIDLISINLVYSADSSYYDILLLNDAYIQMSESGKMYYADYFVKESNLPQQVRDSMDIRFSSENIIEAYYIFEYDFEYYWVAFRERLNLALSIDGIVYYAEGRNFNDLPANARLYIINNHGVSEFSDFYYLEDNSTGTFMYTFQVTLKDEDILIFDRNGNYIMDGKKDAKNSKYIRNEQKTSIFN